jgi:hypothetical protein
MESAINPDFIGEKAIQGENLYDRIGGKCQGYVQTKCLKSIMVEWTKFKKKFYSVGENVLVAKIFENSAFFTDREEFVEEVVFGRNRYGRIREGVRERNVGDFIRNRVCSTKEEIERMLQMTLNMAEYFRLREQVERIILENVQWGRQGKELNILMGKKGSGSGRYREVMEGKNSKWFKERNPKEIVSVQNFWGNRLDTIPRRRIELQFSLWTCGSLPANFKNFLFNLFQGRLYLNSSLAHFTDEHPGCTFCRISAMRQLNNRNIGPDRPEYEYFINLTPAENVNHLFWECEHVHPIINAFFTQITTPLEPVFGRIDQNLNRNLYFEGRELESPNQERAELIFLHFIKYYIYRCRFKRKLPMLNELREEYLNLGSMLAKNKKWGKYLERIWELYLYGKARKKNLYLYSVCNPAK